MSTEIIFDNNILYNNFEESLPFLDRLVGATFLELYSHQWISHFNLLVGSELGCAEKIEFGIFSEVILAETDLIKQKVAEEQFLNAGLGVASFMEQLVGCKIVSIEALPTILYLHMDSGMSLAVSIDSAMYEEMCLKFSSTYVIGIV